MLKTHILVLLVAFSACLCIAEASPFLWLLGVRPGNRGRSRSYEGDAPREKSYGDICRIMNSSPWTSFGYSEPNCPP